MLFIGVALGAVVGGSASYYMFKKYSKQKINLISEKEFNTIIEKNNLLDAYKKGEVVCAVSGERITYNNLGYVDMRSNGEVIFVAKDSVSAAANIPKNDLRATA